MEIMDALAIKAAEASVDAGYPKEAAALLIVELDGEEQQVEAEFELLKNFIADSGASEIRAAETDEERLLIWKGRKSAFSAVGRISPDYLVQDGVVPRRLLGQALAEIESLSRQYDIPVANVFHVIRKLDEAMLEAEYPLELAGVRFNCGDFILHLLSHLAYHLGQVDYHRRIVTGENKTAGSIAIPKLLSAKK